MSHLSDHMNEFFSNGEGLDPSTKNHVKKFVSYIEKFQGKNADRLKAISVEDVQACVEYYHHQGAICTINSLDNHLNALKAFFTYLHKNDMGDDIFHGIKDWGAFRQSMIDAHDLIEAQFKGYLLDEDIIRLLDYFNAHPGENPALSIYCKLMLLAPAKRTTLARLTTADFSADYSVMTVNGVPVNLPDGLKTELAQRLQESTAKKTDGSIFAQITGNKEFKGENINCSLYYALKKAGYAVPEDKESFPVESIRIAAILNLVAQNVSLYAITKVAGMSPESLWTLLETYAQDMVNANVGQQVQMGTTRSSYYKHI